MSGHIVLAGGGTAGHIEPMLATAAAIRALDPSIELTCVGTARGLESTIVPERGFNLELIGAVPLPRKPSLDLLKVPSRLIKAVRQARRILKNHHADVVVGFGGYAALPAYLAARSRKTPLVVHEANPLPGLANKVGARFAEVVAVATPGTPVAGAVVVGMPLRASITSLDRGSLRAEAAVHFGLDPDRRTLLVYGGSQGARTLNNAVLAAAQSLHDVGVQVLHSYGKKNDLTVPRFDGGAAYVGLPYIDRMDLAYAIADLGLCRSGMGTVAEMTAVGLPAIYVPLPHGNGEQRMIAEPIAAAGGAIIVRDQDMSGERLTAEALPILTDPDRLGAMSAAAAGAGHRDAATKLAALVIEVAGL